MSVNWKPQPPQAAAAIPLESLPFPAALVDAGAAFLAVNASWKASRNGNPPGDCLKWCEEIHTCSPELRVALISGIQRVLRGEDAFSQDYESPEGGQHRITASPWDGGALILHQSLGGESPADGDPGRRQSQKMETVGRLVGGVAHDFANLLTLIAGYSDILLNRIGDKDPLRAELDEIRKAANRGARLTGQLLGFTRTQSAEPRPVDLNVLIAEMQRMLRPIIGEHVELETLTGPALGKVIADPGQIEQVIMNLILNARDAMPAGGRIRIESFDGEVGESTARAHGIQPGPCVLLSISDTGKGIDPETIRHIFEPFFTTKDKGKGTGLGLSTVRNIIRQSGGDVWVRSAPGEGACFTLCLPRAPVSSTTTETSDAVRPGASGNETVLLVEDEDGVRKLLTHVLHKRGYQVLEASNGEEALRIFEECGPSIHLVLTDMVMPKMTGRELAERLTGIRPDIKIVYMSGYTDDVLVRTGALGPGMSFLQKPLRPEVLAAKVREALDSPSRPFNPR